MPKKLGPFHSNSFSWNCTKFLKICFHGKNCSTGSSYYSAIKYSLSLFRASLAEESSKKKNVPTKKSNKEAADSDLSDEDESDDDEIVDVDEDTFDNVESFSADNSNSAAAFQIRSNNSSGLNDLKTDTTKGINTRFMLGRHNALKIL